MAEHNKVIFLKHRNSLEHIGMKEKNPGPHEKKQDNINKLTNKVKKNIPTPSVNSLSKRPTSAIDRIPSVHQRKICSLELSNKRTRLHLQRDIPHQESRSTTKLTLNLTMRQW